MECKFQFYGSTFLCIVSTVLQVVEIFEIIIATQILREINFSQIRLTKNPKRLFLPTREPTDLVIW